MKHLWKWNIKTVSKVHQLAPLSVKHQQSVEIVILRISIDNYIFRPLTICNLKRSCFAMQAITFTRVERGLVCRKKFCFFQLLLFGQLVVSTSIDTFTQLVWKTLFTRKKESANKKTERETFIARGFCSLAPNAKEA